MSEDMISKIYEYWLKTTKKTKLEFMCPEFYDYPDGLFKGIEKANDQQK